MYKCHYHKDFRVPILSYYNLNAFIHKIKYFILKRSNLEVVYFKKQKITYTCV